MKAHPAKILLRYLVLKFSVKESKILTCLYRSKCLNHDLSDEPDSPEAILNVCCILINPMIPEIQVEIFCV